MNCNCTAHVRYEASGNTITPILDKIEFCKLHGSAGELLAALEAVIPEGWDDGTMDHMPGIKQARAVIIYVRGNT